MRTMSRWRVFHLNEVLSIRAQESPYLPMASTSDTHLNEVLSIRAQEYIKGVMDSRGHNTSMKS